MRVVRRNEDAEGSPFSFLNGRFDSKVTAAETNGALCIFDTTRTEPGGPPLHVHHAQDEWFFVTEGDFEFQVGEERLQLGPGDSVLGPRGVPHCFANVSPTGRLVIVFQPAGSMEAFFHEGSQRGPMTPADFAALSARHGMTVVGPPIALSRALEPPAG